MDASHQGRVALSIDSFAVRHRHGANGAAMETTLEGNDVRPSSSMASQLERAFDRFSTTAAEEELVETLGYHSLELLGELQHGLVVGNSHLEVGQLGHLLLGSCDDLGVAMARIRYSNAAGEVEQLAAASGVNEAAGALFDDDIRKAGPYGGQQALGIG